MGLGGAILAIIGLVVIVLVANNRWATTWAAMLGNSAGSANPQIGSSQVNAGGPGPSPPVGSVASQIPNTPGGWQG